MDLCVWVLTKSLTAVLEQWRKPAFFFKLIKQFFCSSGAAGDFLLYVKPKGNHVLIDLLFSRLHNILLILLHIFHQHVSWYPWRHKMLFKVLHLLSSVTLFFPITSPHLSIRFFHHHIFESKAYYLASVVWMVANIAKLTYRGRFRKLIIS